MGSLNDLQGEVSDLRKEVADCRVEVAKIDVRNDERHKAVMSAIADLKGRADDRSDEGRRPYVVPPWAATVGKVLGVAGSTAIVGALAYYGINTESVTPLVVEQAQTAPAPAPAVPSGPVPEPVEPPR